MQEYVDNDQADVAESLAFKLMPWAANRAAACFIKKEILPPIVASHKPVRLDPEEYKELTK
jgi:hypothetical protein